MNVKNALMLFKLVLTNSYATLVKKYFIPRTELITQLERMKQNNKKCLDCGTELTKEHTLSDHIFFNSLGNNLVVNN